MIDSGADDYPKAPLIYFADLTTYSYNDADEDASIVNVGWLSKDQEFQRGAVPPDFVHKLDQLIAAPAHLSRGLHHCEFCPPPESYIAKNGLRMVKSDPEKAGNGEIRVTGNDGITYVAPVLIRHYVSAHEYLPPQAFIDAVLSDR